MTHTQVDLQTEQLLTAIHNNMRTRFFDVQRSEAKGLFQTIKEGKAIPFMVIDIPDQGEINCNLVLDHSQCVGKLNFSLFRKALVAHLDRVAVKLKAKEHLNIYTSEASTTMIFHIPGLIEQDGNLNVLVSGLSQEKPGSMTIRLMFLDPGQFKLKS